MVFPSLIEPLGSRPTTFTGSRAGAAGFPSGLPTSTAITVMTVPSSKFGLLKLTPRTQKALAKKIGTTRSAVCRYGRQPENFTLSTLEEVARAMGRQLVVKLGLTGT